MIRFDKILWMRGFIYVLNGIIVLVYLLIWELHKNGLAMFDWFIR